MSQASDKPPYRVPSMDEIRALEPNGIKVISTFSGCGGSSLGYRMAGCTVLGASEFVPAAYEVYKLNASPDTIVWTDDIREMSGLDMLRDVGLSVGELDILDGSPPCAAFSTAGKRSEGWGEVKKYSDTSQRVDDLFYEYARILKEMQPRAFVAENVEGLVKGAAKGYFKAIHKALVACGYNVKAAVLDASYLGVPQRRKRLIFVGTRNDLNLEPSHPHPLPYRYSMKDALPLLGESKLFVKSWSHDVEPINVSRVSPTITATGMMGVNHSEVGFGGRMLFQKAFNSYDLETIEITKGCPTIMAGGMGGVATDQVGFVWDGEAPLEDPETGQDLLHISPKLKLQHSKTNLRRLSIGEVRRLSSFPDDFKLEGTYGKRWERLGRSVPPVMMKHIAESVVRTLCAD